MVDDEVHYLSDRFRGAVWEEVIIHLPDSVTLVSLSATVSNAEEFGDWLDTGRGHTGYRFQHRPVPLFQHVLAGRRTHHSFEEGEGNKKAVNPDLTRLARMEASRPSFQDRRRGRAMREADRERASAWQRSRIWDTGPPRGHRTARRRGPAARDHVHLQPRRPAEAAVQQCLYAGLRLNDEEARAKVREIVEERTASIPSEDLHVLGYYEWLEGLERGIAAHHAGMLPTFKEVVEELFVRGLVKAVFATETLALGINMPARSVVLEKLVKWNGEQHADITPGEYTQLTGRAGRRGIDVEGHAVVLWQRGFSPDHLVGTRGHPHLPAALQLQAVVQHGRETWSSSSAGTARASCWRRPSRSSRPTNRSSGSPGRCSATRRGLEGYKESMTCHLGDFDDMRDCAANSRTARRSSPSRARRSGAPRRPWRWRSSSPATSSMSRPASSRAWRWSSTRAAAGRSNGHRGFFEHHDGPRPLVLTAERQVKRLASMDFPCRSRRWSGCVSRSPSIPRSRSRVATSPPRCAPRPGTSFRTAAQAPFRGRRRPRDRPAAHRDPRPPLPRVQRP